VARGQRRYAVLIDKDVATRAWDRNISFQLHVRLANLAAAGPQHDSSGAFLSPRGACTTPQLIPRLLRSSLYSALAF